MVVLEQGLGFSSNSKIEVANKIGGKSIDWEMGALVLQLMQPSATSPDSIVLIDGREIIRNRPLNTHVPCTNCVGWMAVVAILGVGLWFGYSRYIRHQFTKQVNSLTNSAMGRV